MRSILLFISIRYDVFTRCWMALVLRTCLWAKHLVKSNTKNEVLTNQSYFVPFTVQAKHQNYFLLHSRCKWNTIILLIMQKFFMKFFILSMRSHVSFMMQYLPRLFPIVSIVFRDIDVSCASSPFIKSAVLKSQITAIVCSKFLMMCVWQINYEIYVISTKVQMQHLLLRLSNTSKVQLQVYFSSLRSTVVSVLKGKSYQIYFCFLYISRIHLK